MAQELNLVERRICFLKDLIFAHLCQLFEYVQINKIWTKWEHFRCIDKFLVCGAKGNDLLNQKLCINLSLKHLLVHLYA